MTSYDKLKEVFEVNFFAPVTIMQLMARKMMKQGSGSIINMASVGGIEVNPGYLAYGSSKSSLIFATECLSKEVGLYGVRVNAVAPGPIWTPLTVSSFSDEYIKNFGSDVPMKRAGQPFELAPAYVYLASDDSSYVTGQVIHVNGGTIVNS